MGFQNERSPPFFGVTDRLRDAFPFLLDAAKRLF